MERCRTIPIKRSVLIILCGLPSSGKSRYAIKLADYLSKELPPIPIQIIDIDKVRAGLFEGAFEPENEDFVRETARMQAREYLKNGSIVIIDDINYYNSMRHDFKQIAEDTGNSFIILYISTPLEICLEWNRNRPNCVEDNILITIAEKFDFPGHKYLWDSPFEAIDLSKEDGVEKLNAIATRVHELVNQEISVMGNEPNFIKPSIKQEIDLLTRLFVNYYAKSTFIKERSRPFSENKIENANLHENALLHISTLPQFQEIQLKFISNIEGINTKRRKYVENTRFNGFVLNEINLINILIDFMDYLLK